VENVDSTIPEARIHPLHTAEDDLLILWRARVYGTSAGAIGELVPQHARIMKKGPVKDAGIRLHTLYKERKDPECFM
jgi:hypothetical protein